MKQDIDTRKYLSCLEEDGWTELIDTRWEEEVRQTLKAKFPDMTIEEWNAVSKVTFYRFDKGQHV